MIAFAVLTVTIINSKNNQK
ncbi:hypothetical protein [Listeria ivanovii]